MKATIVLDRDFSVGEVDPRLFGGFAEHLGRCVYEGMYEPGHPEADEHGFRKDVLELIRQLNMPVMRYPGGNFVSGYNWEDGVGPKEQRPSRLELAWNSTESNEFGTNEFIDWCRKANTSPMLAVNLGTRGPDEARDLVEYCNHPEGTRLSDLRREHGWKEPHGVKLWCLGNEMDGPWQMGHKTATEYGRVALETAKLMKLTDPTIELVVCGSSGRGMKTFGAWEAEVLDHTFDHIDYISLHTYIGTHDDDTPGFLAQTDEMSTFIEETVAACDYAAARKKSSKRIMLSFDEWNVWYHSHKEEKPEPWSTAPHLLEDEYTMEDALVVGGMLISLLNHCDRVKIGCIAQIVNVIAPVMTEKGGAAWKQTIFYPFAQASNMGRGTVLRAEVDSPTYKCKGHDEAPYLTSSSVYDGQAGTLTVFTVNRSLDEELDLAVTLRGFPELSFSQWEVLWHSDLKASNTAGSPGEVAPESGGNATLEDGVLHATLQAASWNVIRLTGG